MDSLSTSISGLQELLRALELYAQSLVRPSQLYQIATLVACLLLALLGNRWVTPMMDAWMRGLSKRPKWQLRALVAIRDRMYLLLFAMACWISVGVFKQLYTFPSRRNLLVLVATIATAWFFIRLAALLVRNRLMRNIVIWGMTAYATMYYTGLLGPMTQTLDGLAITFGEFRLSLLSLIKAAVITGILFTVARIGSDSATRRIRTNEDISPTMRVLFVKVLQISLYGAAFFLGLKAVGFDLTGLAVLSGAIGVGLGFGLQKVVSNLVSGIIILLDKSIKPGDVISLGDTFGWINALGARYVSVVTRDGKEYLIPNEDLITGQVVNWSHSNEFVRLDIFFGTAYGDDPHLVRKVAIEACGTVNRVLADRPAVCHIVGFGDSSVDYILRFWIADPTEGLTNIKGHVYLALWDAFKANGISIPFPQREVLMLPGSEIRGTVDEPAKSRPRSASD